jgi:predicted RecB family nuclease
MSEKVLGEEEENFANVVYESELTRLNNNSYVLEGRVRVSKLYMMDTWDKVHEPYSVEVIEILDDGSEGGAIEVEGSVPCVNCECNTCFGDNRCVECTGCAKGEKYKNPNCNGVRK